MAEVTEELLRQVVEEAKEKGQIGLLIWNCWPIWDDVAYQLRPGNKYYDFALEQVSQGKDSSISHTWNGIRLPGTWVVPVEKLDTSKEYFEYISKACKQNHYEGPITLLPLNEIAECIS